MLMFLFYFRVWGVEWIWELDYFIIVNGCFLRKDLKFYLGWIGGKGKGFGWN